MLVSIADVWGATRWCQMDFNTMFHFISVRHDPGETQDPLGQCRVSQWVRGFHLDISWQSGYQCLACRSRCIPPWICIPRSSLTNWSSSCFYKPSLLHVLRFNLRSSETRWVPVDITILVFCGIYQSCSMVHWCAQGLVENVWPSGYPHEFCFWLFGKTHSHLWPAGRYFVALEALNLFLFSQTSRYWTRWWVKDLLQPCTALLE